MKSRWFESNPAHYVHVSEMVYGATLLRWCAACCTEGSNPSVDVLNQQYKGAVAKVDK